MDSLMNSEVRAAGKALSTLTAHVGLLPRMSPTVFAQGGLLGEAFPALRAGKWFLPRVNTLMLHKQRILVEGLPALWTGEGLLSRVNSLVPDEGGLAGEELATDRAGIRLLPCVCSFMYNKLRSS